ncbi:hypothetical protein YC2023_065849 [Brassica napus]
MGKGRVLHLHCRKYKWLIFCSTNPTTTPLNMFLGVSNIYFNSITFNSRVFWRRFENVVVGLGFRDGEMSVLSVEQASEVYTGAVHPLTRYLVAGRKRFSGVTFGEVERDLP